MNKINLFLIFIIILGLSIRLYKINIPLLEFYPSRQIQTADIARNFLRNNFNILNPTVSYSGPGYTPFLVEFPGYNYLVAILYLIFGIHEVIGRYVSLVGWFLSLILVYKIALKISSKTTANIAALFYSISPLSVLISRSFQPDQWMLTFSLAGIYSILLWQRKKMFYFYLSAVFVSVSILAKIPAVIFTLIPISYLVLKSKKDSFKIRNYLYLTISLLPGTFWFIYTYFRNISGLPTSGIFSLSNWFGFEVFLNPKYYLNIFGFEYNLVLLPIGIILFVIGVFQKLKPNQKFLYFWLGGIILYFLIFNKHNMTHEYYHLPFLPIAVLFIGFAGEKVWTAIYINVVLRGILISVLIFTIFLLMIFPTYQRAYKPIDRFSYVTSAADKIRSVTKPSDLIIGSMDSGPSLVYYSNRNGWLFDVNRKDAETLFNFYGVKNAKIINPIEDLEDLRRQGAVIFASANKSQFTANATFAKYMYSNYPVITENDNFIIFSLTSAK